MNVPEKFKHITLTDDTPGEYFSSSKPNDQTVMILSVKELCELEPDKFQIKQIETDGTVCSLFYASGKNIVHSNKSDAEPFEGIIFSCKREVLNDKSVSYTIQTLLI